jgi:hypothetical protein
MPRRFFQCAGHYVHVYIHRKIRLIESNAQCHYGQKIYLLKDFAASVLHV